MEIFNELVVKHGNYKNITEKEINDLIKTMIELNKSHDTLYEELWKTMNNDITELFNYSINDKNLLMTDYYYIDDLGRKLFVAFSNYDFNIRISSCIRVKESNEFFMSTSNIVSYNIKDNYKSILSDGHSFNKHLKNILNDWDHYRNSIIKNIIEDIDMEKDKCKKLNNKIDSLKNDINELEILVNDLKKNRLSVEKNYDENLIE